MSFWQTLAAFLVGGAMTLLTQLILDARREKKSEERAKAADRTEIKMAEQANRIFGNEESVEEILARLGNPGSD